MVMQWIIFCVIFMYFLAVKKPNKANNIYNSKKKKTDGEK